MSGELRQEAESAPYDVPVGWTWCALGDLAGFLNGDRSKNYPSKAHRVAAGIPFINAGHLGASGVEFERMDYITPERFELLSGGKVQPGDVLYCLRGSLGKCAVVGDLSQGAIASSLVIVRPETMATSSAYLLYYLRSQLGQSMIEKYDNGSAQPNLSAADVARFLVPLAPVAEQRRIITKVEELLAEVNRAKARLTKVQTILRRFRQSVLAAACSGELTRGWREQRGLPDCQPSKLGELVAEGPQNGLYKAQSAYGKGSLIVRIDDFHDGRLLRPWTHLRRLCVSEEERDGYALKDGDVLINRVNSPKFVGKVMLVQGLAEDAVFESNMMRVRFDESRIDPEFALLALMSPQGRQELQKNAKHAVNQSSINQRDLCDVSILVPDKAEQVEIVARVARTFAVMDGTEKRVQSAWARAEKLPQAILSKALAGELVPTEAELARLECREYEPAEALLERLKNNTAPNTTKAKKRAARRQGVTA
jgi:type I restriction enzyme, S subunit